jgi:hypothetical protein
MLACSHAARSHPPPIRRGRHPNTPQGAPEAISEEGIKKFIDAFAEKASRGASGKGSVVPFRHIQVSV